MTDPQTTDPYLQQPETYPQNVVDSENKNIVLDWWNKLPGSHYPLYFEQLTPIMHHLATLIRACK